MVSSHTGLKISVPEPTGHTQEAVTPTPKHQGISVEEFYDMMVDAGLDPTYEEVCSAFSLLDPENHGWVDPFYVLQAMENFLGSVEQIPEEEEEEEEGKKGTFDEVSKEGLVKSHKMTRRRTAEDCFTESQYIQSGPPLSTKEASDEVFSMETPPVPPGALRDEHKQKLAEAVLQLQNIYSNFSVLCETGRYSSEAAKCALDEAVSTTLPDFEEDDYEKMGVQDLRAKTDFLVSEVSRREEGMMAVFNIASTLIAVIDRREEEIGEARNRNERYQKNIRELHSRVAELEERGGYFGSNRGSGSYGDTDRKRFSLEMRTYEMEMAIESMEAELEKKSRALKHSDEARDRLAKEVDTLIKRKRRLLRDESRLTMKTQIDIKRYDPAALTKNCDSMSSLPGDLLDGESVKQLFGSVVQLSKTVMEAERTVDEHVAALRQALRREQSLMEELQIVEQRLTKVEIARECAVKELEELRDHMHAMKEESALDPHVETAARLPSRQRPVSSKYDSLAQELAEVEPRSRTYSLVEDLNAAQDERSKLLEDLMDAKGALKIETQKSEALQRSLQRYITGAFKGARAAGLHVESALTPKSGPSNPNGEFKIGTPLPRHRRSITAGSAGAVTDETRENILKLLKKWGKNDSLGRRSEIGKKFKANSKRRPSTMGDAHQQRRPSLMEAFTQPSSPVRSTAVTPTIDMASSSVPAGGYEMITADSSKNNSVDHCEVERSARDITMRPPRQSSDIGSIEPDTPVSGPVVLEARSLMNTRLYHSQALVEELSRQVRSLARLLSTQKRPGWVMDKDFGDCFQCHEQFGLLRRRHHCRACGGLFCKNCAQHKADLPWFGFKSKVRVCTACVENISRAMGAGPSKKWLANAK